MRSPVAILILSIVSSAVFCQPAGPFVPHVNLPGTDAKLPGVRGIAVDAAGNVFFSSGGDNPNSVLRWDAATGILSTFAGNGTPGYSGDNGPAASAQLNGVTDVAVDGAGNLFIADSNNAVVRKVSNGLITTVAGGGAPPDCVNCTATSAYLDTVLAVATDAAGNLYIFHRYYFRKVSNGMITAPVSYGETLGLELNLYIADTAAADSAGNIYFADAIDNQIRKISNGQVSVVVGSGTPGFSGDNGPALDAKLTGPRGIALDAAGNLYIADTGNQRIRKVSNGVITTVVGGGAPSNGLGDNGPASSAVLNYPWGVGVDSSGSIYIEDTLDNRIRKVSGGVITTIAGGGSSPVLFARSAGTFANTGSMSTGRTLHTATLLNDGKVLVAGGSGSTSAELYDPSTGTFAATGSMGSALGPSIATLLPDGRVLMVGMTDPPSPTLATSQLYDPSSGIFTASGNAVAIQLPQTATLLNNGRVLITGVAGVGSCAIFVAELYDPSTGTFASTGGCVGSGRSYPAATLLPDGNVFFANGSCGAQLYTSTTGLFTPIAGTPSCSPGQVAVFLASGWVLVISNNGFRTEIYDPATGGFANSGGLDTVYATTTTLPDSTVLITGGNPCVDLCLDFWDDEDSPSLADANLYDPSTGTFGFAGLMNTVRTEHQATLLPDGSVLISGGMRITSTEETVLSSAEIYKSPVLVPAPVLFSLSGDGKGQGAVWHAASGQIASSQNPAIAGEVLSMYTTSLIPGGVIPPRVVIGGKLADIQYFGDAPNYPGYSQVNVRVPGGVATGSAVSVRLNYLNRPSNEVTIGLK